MSGAPEGITLVTGATRGIGRAIVDLLVARGEQVVGIARNADPGFPAPLRQADLSDPAEAEAVLAGIAREYRVHRLVNNAGFNRIQKLGEITPDAWSAIVDLNLRSTLLCTQAVLPSMLAAAEAGDARCRIVNISSRSLLGRVGGSVYSAVKAGLVGFTRSWALELAPRGITVNCVAPAPVETEMFRRNNPPGDPRTEAMLAGIPMRRVGRPEEVAAAVDYFLSGAASFTTGQTLFVCGGASISQIHL
jgi:NAD(P)-dependent dehydrogenase (short-subunit alcohol dehydrogenase family)